MGLGNCESTGKTDSQQAGEPLLQKQVPGKGWGHSIGPKYSLLDNCSRVISLMIEAAGV